MSRTEAWDVSTGTQPATLARILASATPATQPAVHATCQQSPPLGVVLGSLAIGGAERIVLDWAAQSRARHDIRLCVLNDQPQEWPVPPGMEIVRLRGSKLDEGLQAFAQGLRQASDRLDFGLPRVLCHMTSRAHRNALLRGGVSPVPVLHNARQGWKEPFDALPPDQRIVAVSEACVQDLRACGREGDISLIRHLPRAAALSPEARATLRSRLCHTLQLPDRSETRLLVMVGGIKAQKNYPFAIQLLDLLARDADACLVIFGGPIGADGAQAWQALRDTVRSLGLQQRVRLPGFVPYAARYLPAFDACLNTSHYEGLSIATLEALVARVPVIASKVGGQGEVAAPGLTLLAPEADLAHWADAVRQAWLSRPEAPAWSGFPAHRLWTLEHLVTDVPRREHVVFVTANLNAGGAQRSLVNLVARLHECLSLEVVVTGRSSASHFFEELRSAGVNVARAGDSRDSFDQAEALLCIAAHSRCAVMCFWNLDPKLKLLLGKVLPASVKLVDVSPGAYAFEEMSATAGFQQRCGFTQAAFYARLARLVLKYEAEVPGDVGCTVEVIRNGVPPAAQGVHASGTGCITPNVIVNGRIAPSKFLVEVAQAMGQVWQRHPEVELHLLGTAEPRHQAYADELLRAIDAARQASPGCAGAVFHGAAYELGTVAHAGDIAVVLGHHQGCPNAVLEAMAHGLAVIANDSGGTAEMVRDGQTGQLLQGTEPAPLAHAIESLLADATRRQRLGRAGRAFVEQHFSMAAMTRGYLALVRTLFKTLSPTPCSSSAKDDAAPHDRGQERP